MKTWSQPRGCSENPEAYVTLAAVGTQLKNKWEKQKIQSQLGG